RNREVLGELELAERAHLGLRRVSAQRLLRRAASGSGPASVDLPLDLALFQLLVAERFEVLRRALRSADALLPRTSKRGRLPLGVAFLRSLGPLARALCLPLRLVDTGRAVSATAACSSSSAAAATSSCEGAQRSAVEPGQRSLGPPERRRESVGKLGPLR